MNLKFVFAVCLCLFSLQVLADRQNWVIERSLHAHMVPFQFEYWVNLEDRDEYFAYLSVKTAKGELIQTIPQLNVHLKPSDLEFVDLNFDGRLDLKIKTPSLATKAPKQYFFYDDVQGKFSENKQLGELGNFEIDPNTQCIIAKWQDQNSRAVDYYQYVGNQLVLIKQEMTTCRDQSCEKILLTNQNGTLNEQQREAINAENSDLREYLAHLVSRKGVCLAKIKEYRVQNDEMTGLNEASQCLNTITYELLPMITAYHPDRALSLQLKDILEKHSHFIKDLVTCELDESSCADFKNKAALRANIHLIDGVVEQLVFSISANEMTFNQGNWLAKWKEMNEIMQG